MAQKNRYPIIRISKLANKRADEIVKALAARGITDVSKSSVVSELILSMPIPAAPEGEAKKRRTPKRETVQAAAL
jgi:hypothetical protein